MQLYKTEVLPSQTQTVLYSKAEASANGIYWKVGCVNPNASMHTMAQTKLNIYRDINCRFPVPARHFTRQYKRLYNGLSNNKVRSTMTTRTLVLLWCLYDTYLADRAHQTSMWRSCPISTFKHFLAVALTLLQKQSVPSVYSMEVTTFFTSVSVTKR